MDKVWEFSLVCAGSCDIRYCLHYVTNVLPASMEVLFFYTSMVCIIIAVSIRFFTFCISFTLQTFQTLVFCIALVVWNIRPYGLNSASLKKINWYYKNMLKRREECDSYLTHICRRHSSRDSPVKRLNIRSFQPTLWL